MKHQTLVIGRQLLWRVLIGNEPQVWSSKRVKVNLPHPLVGEPGKQNTNKSTNTQNTTLCFTASSCFFFLIWLSRTSRIISCIAVVRRIFLTWEGTHFHNLATCHLHKDHLQKILHLRKLVFQKESQIDSNSLESFNTPLYPFWNIFILAYILHAFVWE